MSAAGPIVPTSALSKQDMESVFSELIRARNDYERKETKANKTKKGARSKGDDDENSFSDGEDEGDEHEWVGDAGELDGDDGDGDEEEEGKEEEEEEDEEKENEQEVEEEGVEEGGDGKYERDKGERRGDMGTRKRKKERGGRRPEVPRVADGNASPTLDRDVGEGVAGGRGGEIGCGEGGAGDRGGRKRARAQLESVATRAGGAPKRARADEGPGAVEKAGVKTERETKGVGHPREQADQAATVRGAPKRGNGREASTKVSPASRGREAVTVKRTAPASGGGGSKPIAPKRKSGSALGGDGGGPRKRRSVDGSQTVEQGSRRSERLPSASPKVSLLVAKPEGDAPRRRRRYRHHRGAKGQCKGSSAATTSHAKDDASGSDRDDGDGASSD